MLTFFFFFGDKFFGKNVRTLTQIARKIKVARNFYNQEGPVPPGPPTSYAYAFQLSRSAFLDFSMYSGIKCCLLLFLGIKAGSRSTPDQS